MLPAHARLAQSRGFRLVYSRGRSYVSDLIVVYVLPRPAGSRVRFGFSVGKKVGRAVQRNRAKRLMREAARALLPRISAVCDIVIVARRDISSASLSDIRAALDVLLSRAGVLSGAGER